MISPGRILLAAIFGMTVLTGSGAAMAQAASDWQSPGPNLGGPGPYVRQPYHQGYYPQPQYRPRYNPHYEVPQYVSPKILRKQAELAERRARKQAELDERIYRRYGYAPRQNYYQRPPRYYEHPPRYGW